MSGKAPDINPGLSFDRGLRILYMRPPQRPGRIDRASVEPGNESQNLFTIRSMEAYSILQSNRFNFFRLVEFI
jgi:hypothetical protein